MKRPLRTIAVAVGLFLLSFFVIVEWPVLFNDLIGSRKWIEFGNPEGFHITEYCEQDFWFAPVKRYALNMENHPEWGHSKYEGATWVTREELPNGELGAAREWAGFVEVRPPHLDLTKSDD
jgi:hypothetical protein